MQPDRGFIENIEDTDQTRTDLSRQPNTLRLAAGQCACRARQRQVLQADVQQESQPELDLLEYLTRDGLLTVPEGQGAQELRAVGDG
ncbi:Uncharacterised protein [Mycobacteroides abscessus]|nr:Uncharacterised protein [Mycobacteroides abscessus]